MKKIILITSGLNNYPANVYVFDNKDTGITFVVDHKKATALEGDKLQLLIAAVKGGYGKAVIALRDTEGNEIKEDTPDTPAEVKEDVKEEVVQDVKEEVAEVKEDVKETKPAKPKKEK